MGEISGGLGESPLHSKLDAAFRSACRSILGEEIGGLGELRGYLTSASRPAEKRKSAVSGKDVCLYYGKYPKKGRFIADSEVGRLPAPKLDANSIKDIDSLLGAVRENFFYAGDKHLGNNAGIEASDGIMDCGFMLGVCAAYNSQYAAYSEILLESKYVFGCTYSAFCNFMVKSYHNYRASRLFETGYSHTSSDLHFCWRMEYSQECLFSMNQVNAKFMVGNNALPREKYFALRKKLLGEIAEKIRKRKTFPGIFKIAEGGAE
jgi:hypothetical protein